MTSSKQIVIIGGGHNGLVCAAYLAKAGKDVVVLEAADQVGGASITREFSPGFRVSAGAHLLNLLDSEISKELALKSNGLKIAKSNLRTVALSETGSPLTLSGSRVEGSGISDDDKAALKVYQKNMGRFAKLLAKVNKQKAPRIVGGERSDLIALGKLALDLRLLGKTDMREFLRIAAINIYDVLEEKFDNDLLKGALSLDGVLGAHLGPRSSNSVFVALQRLSGKMGGKRGSRALPAGGMGSVTQAIAESARQCGATIRTSASVSRIIMDNGVVQGVALADGEQISAGVVVSNADPRTTLFKLLGAQHLEAGFARKIQHIRMRGNSAKLHLALDGLPEFKGVDAGLLGERLLIAPDLGYVERAFDHVKYGECSAEPILEITIPSVHDDSLAPAGKHVLSAIVQYVPHTMGSSPDSGRDSFKENLLDLLDRYAPGLREQVVAIELLTPFDMEKEFGMIGGHWHHGELALDQALMMRPVPGAAQHSTPIPGLYLCGAGCHPGGGVMGIAGRNAAAAVMSGEQ
jgi:phytoene dehydrogenase-like protein